MRLAESYWWLQTLLEELQSLLGSSAVSSPKLFDWDQNSATGEHAADHLKAWLTFESVQLLLSRSRS